MINFMCVLIKINGTDLSYNDTKIRNGIKQKLNLWDKF